MLKSSKVTMMAVVASLGVASLSNNMVVVTSGVNCLKFFRSIENLFNKTIGKTKEQINYNN